MRELQMGTRLIQTESRDWLHLEYSVLIGDQESGVEQYGLKIAQQNGIEAIAVENITFSSQRIFLLLSLLINYTVTPEGCAGRLVVSVNKRENHDFKKSRSSLINIGQLPRLLFLFDYLRFT